jgi:hypothetical protein
MSDMARNLEQHQEYWRPAVDLNHAREEEVASETCQNCGTDYALGARFCHVCGRERDPRLGASIARKWSVTRVLDLEQIKSSLGLPIASIVAFFVGLACLVAAAVTGFMYTATTLLDWQAVQVWRIEWLLASIAALAVGLLLKR